MGNPYPKMISKTEEELREITYPIVANHFKIQEEIEKEHGKVYIFDKNGNDVTDKTLNDIQREYIEKRFKKERDESRPKI